ncbi:hypothetical protein LshimejAT787_0101590 [Lyophyllum shimeji]|uniref:Uncharacterized protein n=1 Tax=Lyophyllum shimeji TaxID=47721 RepID=A0A9P3PC81_LYOSH|nr:hypothetical protein LshimejAT787_0101590 [Lyophyllum shimeji]
MYVLDPASVGTVSSCILLRFSIAVNHPWIRCPASNSLTLTRTLNSCGILSETRRPMEERTHASRYYFQKIIIDGSLSTPRDDAHQELARLRVGLNPSERDYRH